MNAIKAGEFRFRHQGDLIRVVIVEDVLALPDERWSMGGFGSSISVEWLLHEARLPGSKARRRVLADCLVRALDALHESRPAAGSCSHVEAVPVLLTVCPACNGEGFAPKVTE